MLHYPSTEDLEHEWHAMASGVMPDLQRLYPSILDPLLVDGLNLRFIGTSWTRLLAECQHHNDNVIGAV